MIIPNQCDVCGLSLLRGHHDHVRKDDTATLGPRRETIVELTYEMQRARLKFPKNRNLLAALTEESGELAKELLQGGSRARIQAEALQVACVALRIYEEGDASFDNLSDEERKA